MLQIVRSLFVKAKQYPLCLSVFIAIALTPAAAKAVDVTATDGEFTDRVDISWTEDADANRYTIYRCDNTDFDSCSVIGKRDDDETRKFSDFDATPLVVYNYRVSACFGKRCEEEGLSFEGEAWWDLLQASRIQRVGTSMHLFREAIQLHAATRD